MPISYSEKNELLDRLSVCYNRVNYIKVLFEERNQPQEAVKFEMRGNTLKTEIDGLLHDLYREWVGEASELRGRLDTSNGEVQQCVKEIEKDINIAENIVKALGYIDDVIGLAAGLTPKGGF